MKIYSDYDEEPQEQFKPLPSDIYTLMYDLEMANFTEDLQYYANLLAADSTVLELGCGTGRLSRLLAGEGHRVTGIDLSDEMLTEARKRASNNTSYIQMDMRELALGEKFDTVIIPYNTLNLLLDEEDILRTLRGCWNHLRADGQLMLQLYLHIAADDDTDGTSFQFQMFDRPEGGKIIKEIIKSFDEDAAVLEMTERYKIRPMTAGQANINYSHTLKLNCCNQEQWLQFLDSAGFQVLSSSNSYSATSTTAPSMLLLHCRKK